MVKVVWQLRDNDLRWRSSSYKIQFGDHQSVPNRLKVELSDQIFYRDGI